MKRLMVTGASGMTGSEVSERAKLLGWNVGALSRSELDITDPGSVNAAARQFGPDIVINCAAYTAVDRAESEPQIAAAVNADGARNVAGAAASLRIPVIHLSTDYVFSGDARVPYPPDARTDPLSVYGETKLAGELAVRDETADHVIVRTSWVFSHRGSNFVRSVIRMAAERDELRIVDDQTGRPTSAADLADALLVVAETMLENRAKGTFHFANADETSWFGLAQAIFAQVGGRPGSRVPRLVPIPTSEFPTAARRPAYSVLDTTSFTQQFAVVPRSWRDALHDTLALM
jgi:dTDP-4-dehydrorhamnose reductase